MKLNYKAVRRDGGIIRGIIEAKDVQEAARYLRGKEIFPISIAPFSDKSITKNIPFLNKTTGSDVIFFTRQLSSMLTSGLTIMQALNILKDETKSETMAEIVRGVIVDIEEGKPLSLAISKYPDTFSSVYVSIVRAAEAAGLLDRALLRLSETLEKQQRLKSTIKAALMYPSIILIGISVVVFIMMVFVVPQLTKLYEGLNIELPLPTKIVIGISNFFVTFWPLLIIGLILSIFLYIRWHKTENGQLIIDNLMLKLPIFGKLIKETILTEFTRTFGLLISAGTPVVESLNQTSGITGNVHFKNSILGVSRRVERGIPVGDALSVYPLFPSMVIEMVKIGEKTGKMDESLMKLSEYFEREVDQTVRNLTTAMEPIIMIVLGIGVAFLIISIITPIYKLTSAI